MILDGPQGRLCETVGEVPGQNPMLPAAAEHIIMVRVKPRGAPKRLKWWGWHTLPASGEPATTTTTLVAL